MIGVALKGLLGRKLRAALTAFAIVLGVAMISGSFVLTDTLSKSFDGIYDETYSCTDAVISSEEATDTTDTTPRLRRSPPMCCARSRASRVCASPRGRSRTRREWSTRTARRSETRTRASPSASTPPPTRA